MITTCMMITTKSKCFFGLLEERKKWIGGGGVLAAHSLFPCTYVIGSFMASWLGHCQVMNRALSMLGIGSLMMTIWGCTPWWSFCNLYLLSTCLPGKSYLRRFRSLNASLVHVTPIECSSFPLFVESECICNLFTSSQLKSSTSLLHKWKTCVPQI